MISICAHGGLVRSMIGGVNEVKERGWQEKGENEGRNEQKKRSEVKSEGNTDKKETRRESESTQQ